MRYILELYLDDGTTTSEAVDSLDAAFKRAQASFKVGTLKRLAPNKLEIFPPHRIVRAMVTEEDSDGGFE